jgi:CHASE3 domain sensor protein
MFDLKAIALVTCALTPPAVVAFIAFTQTQVLTEQNAQIIHEHKVHEKTNQILTDVTEAETSVRGFTITGKDEFLTLYFSATPKLETHTRELEDLLAEDPEQAKKLQQLDPLIHEKLERLERIVMARKQKGFEDAANIIKDGQGRLLMIKIRKLVQEMEAAEIKTEQHAKTAETDGSKLTRVAIVLATFALALICINLFFMRLR